MILAFQLKLLQWSLFPASKISLGFSSLQEKKKEKKKAKKNSQNRRFFYFISSYVSAKNLSNFWVSQVDVVALVNGHYSAKLLIKSAHIYLPGLQCQTLNSAVLVFFCYSTQVCLITSNSLLKLLLSFSKLSQVTPIYTRPKK